MWCVKEKVKKTLMPFINFEGELQEFEFDNIVKMFDTEKEALEYKAKLEKENSKTFNKIQRTVGNTIITEFETTECSYEVITLEKYKEIIENPLNFFVRHKNLGFAKGLGKSTYAKDNDFKMITFDSLNQTICEPKIVSKDIYKKNLVEYSVYYRQQFDLYKQLLGLEK